jgi:hypothetical protein
MGITAHRARAQTLASEATMQGELCLSSLPMSHQKPLKTLGALHIARKFVAEISVQLTRFFFFSGLPLVHPLSRPRQTIVHGRVPC